MARINGSVEKNTDSYKFYIETTESKVDENSISTNKTTLQVDVYLHCIKHTADRYASANGIITIDGTSYNTELGEYHLSPRRYFEIRKC